MLKRLAKSVRAGINRLGVDIRPYASRERIYRDMEPEFFKIYDACAPFTMTSIERLYGLYKSVEYLCGAGIPVSLSEHGAVGQLGPGPAAE